MLLASSVFVQSTKIKLNQNAVTRIALANPSAMHVINHNGIYVRYISLCVLVCVCVSVCVHVGFNVDQIK